MFIVVVRAGTFPAAARQIHITPSAVSKMIGRLESELGVALFDRSTKTLTLTPEGEVYYGGVMRVLSDLDETQRQLIAGKWPQRGGCASPPPCRSGCVTSSHSSAPTIRAFQKWRSTSTLPMIWPSWPGYWRATPTECLPFFGKLVSSMIQASICPGPRA